MDSLDLISLNSKRISIKNKNKERKNYTKCIIISLIFLFISNLFNIFFIFILYKKICSMNNQKGTKESDNISNKNKIKVNDSYNNNNYLIEEYIKRQNNFCNYPDKFYNQEFEEIIKLTNFSFRNISYQMYVYKYLDNYMSNEILNTGQYEPYHMSHFLDILKYYGEKNNIKKMRIYL